MLSNPSAESSGGSSSAGSTFNASRSRIALAYSARFSRCGNGRPGFGRLAAARSNVVSRNDTSASCAAASGRGIPAGGIAPARSFRITFSHISPSWTMRVKSARSRMTPEAVAAVRFRSLWQVAQYCLIVRSRSALAGDVSDGACARGADEDTVSAHVATASTMATRPPRMTRMSSLGYVIGQRSFCPLLWGGADQGPLRCAAMWRAFRPGVAVFIAALWGIASSAQSTLVRFVDVAADAGLNLVNVSGGPSKDFIVDANGNGA